MVAAARSEAYAVFVSNEAYATDPVGTSALLHELLAPATALRLQLEQLRESRLRPDEQSRAIEDCLSELGELEHLIRDFLLIARAEAGKLPVAPVSFAILPLLERLAFRFEPMARARNIDFAMEEARATAFGNEEQVFRVLSNLIDNAIKFTPAGGAVRLTLTEVDAGTVALTVTDTGPGIPGGAENSVFKPFVQLGEPRESGGSRPRAGDCLDTRKSERWGTRGNGETRRRVSFYSHPSLPRR